MKPWRLALLLAASIAHAAPNNEPASFDLREIRVAQVVQLVYGEVIKTPYMLEPEVLADNRIISFRYGARQGDPVLSLLVTSYTTPSTLTSPACLSTCGKTRSSWSISA